MPHRVLTILFLLLTGYATTAEAQVWPFKKKSQVEKATKDLEKRKADAGEGNLFNPFQPTGSSVNYIRDDQIWSAGTAATSYANAGNISITTPSRFGLTSGLELSTWLGLDYWVPNLFIKNEIARKKLWVSSLHGVYSSWPGLNEVAGGKDNFLADSVTGDPLVLSLHNQLIVSRPFYNNMACNPSQPYLILSASLSVDVGIPFNNEEIYVEENLFKIPRSMSYAGKGWMSTFSVRADWQIMQQLYGRGEIRMLSGNFSTGITVEHQALIEYFPYTKLSVSGGYIVGIGNIGNRHINILPFLDVSYYFGRKQGRQRGLFKQQMF
ncbi:hypothetical protein ACT29H_06310 [Thermophagus sp. OGC60D27]|uniref:hypothetical protein n=1 Tax=Thermophagus sp. OGC60D27 TaxID=3458415 RepID=UPI004037699C